VSYFSLDFLIMALRAGLPDFDVSSEHPDPELAERLWPLLKPMCANIIEVGENYTIEGAYLLPGQVQELLDYYADDVRVVFLGYADISLNAKFHAIRSAHGMPNDWMQGVPDQMLLDFVQRGIHESRQLRKQCVALGLSYVETSREFDTQLKRAATLLLSGNR
jgi:hypothetical protein